MKKPILSLLVAFLCAMSINAQVDTLMRVTRTDGKLMYLPLSEIDRVDFILDQERIDPTPGQNTFEDYFDVKVTRCERISTVLILEFDVTNLTPTEKTFTFKTYDIKSEDNLHNEYGVKTQYAFGAMDFSSSARSVKIEGYGTEHGAIRIKDFDKSNKAASVSISPVVSIEGVSLDVSKLNISAAVTDARPVRGGVQTCDKNLVFTIDGCERVGKVLILDYTLTNTGDTDIQSLDVTSYLTGSMDDLNNSYDTSTQCAFGNQNYSNSKSIPLRAGNSVKGHIRVKEFDATNKAEYISVNLKFTSKDYRLEDALASFMMIDITDNRVLSRGIQSCDRNLDFKYTGFRIVQPTVDDPCYGYLDFTITNTGSVDIPDFKMNVYNIDSVDDLANSYSLKTYFAFGSQKFAQNNKCHIGAGETVSGHLRLTDFNINAGYLYIVPLVSSTEYILDDPDKVYFIRIPVAAE